MATVFAYPSAEDFSTAVFGKLAGSYEFGQFPWTCSVAPDGIIRFTDTHTGLVFSVTIDGAEGDEGSSMWVNVCEGAMSPDFEPLEFGSVDAAVAGVAAWLTEKDAE